MISLSKDQQYNLNALLEWYDKDRISMQYVSLGGYAGTGKTTLIAVLRDELEKHQPGIKVSFACYTGKAARVLAQTIALFQTKYKKDTVGTIHSLIYSPVVNDREEIVGWKRKDSLDCDLIIIDEASMVDEFIWNHLIAFQKPMIVVGDHGQLPPIEGAFNLMQKTDLHLEEIHRQAKDNPIISVSIQARLTGKIDVGRYGKTVVKYDRVSPEAQETVEELLNSYNTDTLVLCGFNATRKRLNAHIRSMLGFQMPEPSNGDRVICLRNNHKKNIFNGMLGTIQDIRKRDETWYEAEIQMDGEADSYTGFVSVEQFGRDTAMNFTTDRVRTIKGDLFDFGYALTVHKAQGSQAKRVILFEERFGKMSDDDWRRWLYTAITRAQEELYMFG